MAKKRRTEAQYDQVFDDLVDTYSLDTNLIFGKQSFEEQMELIDTRSVFKKPFINKMFGRSQDIIDENVEKENKRLKEDFSAIRTSEDLNKISELELSNIKDKTFQKIIEEEYGRRLNIIAQIEARRIKQEQKKQRFKLSLFQDPGGTVLYGRYRKWSSLQNFYNLTDEELSQLQSENPEINLS